MVVFRRYKKPNGAVDPRSTNQYALGVKFILAPVLFPCPCILGRFEMPELLNYGECVRQYQWPVQWGTKHELWHPAHSCTHINAIEAVIRDVSHSPFTPVRPNYFHLAMLRINPNAVPFALTADNKVPLSNRDDIFWDESGDVLLITKDKIAVLFQKALLLQYSETARSALGHIDKQPQDDRWMPILELGCSATELRDVLEYLLSRKQYVLLPSIQLGRVF